MARYSETAQSIKLEAGDIVRNAFDMRGKVQQVMVMVTPTESKNYVDVLVTVDYTRGEGEPNVVCLEELSAVRYNGAWVNLKGEPITA